MNKIILRQLTEEFYNDHTHLVEIMDKNQSNQFYNKGRGYGVLLTEVYGFKFAIPLRSNMKHNKNFATQTNRDESGKIIRKGLDYSKAVIIRSQTDYSTQPFMIPNEEFQTIINSEIRINKQFTKYIEKYIKACRKQDQNILRDYAKSTLKNYHVELGLVPISQTI